MKQIEARKLILHALYHDNWLVRQLVLKGGNALSMIYNVGNRTSLDLDFSISDDFADYKKASKRIETALVKTFKKQNIRVFDFSFKPKPKQTNYEWWGGYRAEFKLISEEVARKLNNDIKRLRVQSLPIDAGSQKRKFSIEISKFEYIENYKKLKYDGMNILVYSPLLLAIEKLRALFQQHPDYIYISNNAKRSRSKDLYDIWTICDYYTIKLSGHLDIVQEVFKAKQVSLELLNDLEAMRDLHRASWEDVELSVGMEIQDFDFYFIFKIFIFPMEKKFSMICQIALIPLNNLNKNYI